MSVNTAPDVVAEEVFICACGNVVKVAYWFSATQVAHGTCWCGVRYEIIPRRP